MNFSIESKLYEYMEKLLILIIVNCLIWIGAIGGITNFAPLYVLSFVIDSWQKNEKVTAKDIFKKIKVGLIQTLPVGTIFIIITAAMSYNSSIIGSSEIIKYIRVIVFAHMLSVFIIYLIMIQRGNPRGRQLFFEAFRRAGAKPVLTFFLSAVLLIIMANINVFWIFIIFPVVIEFFVIWVFSRVV